MTNVKSEMDQALLQLRALSASMSRTVSELEAAGVWSGTDAEAFSTSWQDEVLRNLTIAASALESVSYTPAG
jgi:hypothetical protein